MEGGGSGKRRRKRRGRGVSERGTDREFPAQDDDDDEPFLWAGRAALPIFVLLGSCNETNGQTNRAGSVDNNHPRSQHRTVKSKQRIGRGGRTNNDDNDDDDGGEEQRKGGGGRRTAREKTIVK